MSTDTGPAADRPIRILHVLGVLNMGGAESRIMDLYRHIDRSLVQFDFLVHTSAQVPAGVFPGSDELMACRAPEAYDEEARSLGAHIYALPRFNGRNLALYRRAAERFFAEHHAFAAVEGHMTSMASVYLPIAKRAGVPVTIAHARNAGVDAGIRGIATRALRSSLPRRADYLLACSRLAGEAAYGRRRMESGEVEVVPNALETEDFRFDPGVRRRVRVELGIPENALVLGHTGRFDDNKNHRYLAERFAALSKAYRQGPPPRLLCIGEGRRMEAVRRYLQEEGCGSQLLFPGLQSRSRTKALYQAMDVFVFPSLYEGLPGTVIEAQAAGLPCLISDRITEEVQVTPLVRRLSLEHPKEWDAALLQAAEEFSEKTRIESPRTGKPGNAAADSGGGVLEAAAESECEADRVRAARSGEAQRLLAEAGFNIREHARKMQEWYLGLTN